MCSTAQLLIIVLKYLLKKTPSVLSNGPQLAIFRRAVTLNVRPSKVILIVKIQLFGLPYKISILNKNA